MKIGDILRSQQPNEYIKLNNKRKKKERAPKKEHLSFYDIRNLMQHDSHKRRKGAIVQRSWGK
ncbi:hypothetical protein [Oxobacter pfennigii]|uniref:hypothetical protein n=1 Tax=Oxobacter pfennigii TaxID=36849 RepID=UPI0006D4298B|nr:hypothetical protein [Oxobacter pfennigii]